MGLITRIVAKILVKATAMKRKYRKNCIEAPGGTAKSDDGHRGSIAPHVLFVIIL